MADIANLGIKVDSDQVKSGAKDLDDFKRAAQGADNAVENLRKTTDQSARANRAASAERQKSVAAAKAQAQAMLQAAQAASRDAQTLQQLELAAQQAKMAKQQLEAVSENLTAAERREAGIRELLREATETSTVATRSYTAALNAQNAATRQASMRMQQMVYQSNDIIVSLVSGQAAYMVAMQQGGQLAQIYGGRGGVSQAFKDVASMARTIAVRFWPVAVAVGAVAAATAGLTAAINENSEVTVTMGDTFQAVILVARDAIVNMLQPAIQAIGPYMEYAWEVAKAATAVYVNFTVRSVLSAFETLKATVRTGAIVVSSNIEMVFVALQQAIQASINFGIDSLNRMIEAYNKINVGLEDLD